VITVTSANHNNFLTMGLTKNYNKMQSLLNN